ncbi:unnamed protein product [Polarella glacialis]|uniref:Kinesin light chain n=1 Tax=Polarella glacialis TaxID=89957 RepID=A0A813HRY5_POLGL|nr:unnamed protein product [Polarella glacialis]
MAADGRKRTLGSSSSVTLEAQDALAAHLVATHGRAQEAELVQREALAARDGLAAGSSHRRPDRSMLLALSTLGQALRLQKKLQESAVHFRKAYELCRDTQELGGPTSPNTFAAASNLASVLHEAGESQEAGRLYKMAALGLQRTLGLEYPNTRGARQNYESFLKEAHLASEPENES